jgi:hypothetical protein
MSHERGDRQRIHHSLPVPPALEGAAVYFPDTGIPACIAGNMVGRFYTAGFTAG